MVTDFIVYLDMSNGNVRSEVTIELLPYYHAAIMCAAPASCLGMGVRAHLAFQVLKEGGTLKDLKPSIEVEDNEDMKLKGVALEKAADSTQQNQYQRQQQSEYLQEKEMKVTRLSRDIWQVYVAAGITVFEDLPFTILNLLVIADALDSNSSSSGSPPATVMFSLGLNIFMLGMKGQNICCLPDMWAQRTEAEKDAEYIREQQARAPTTAGQEPSEPMENVGKVKTQEAQAGSASSSKEVNANVKRLTTNSPGADSPVKQDSPDTAIQVIPDGGNAVRTPTSEPEGSQHDAS